jgi:hypothetical protein
VKAVAMRVAVPARAPFSPPMARTAVVLITED